MPCHITSYINSLGDRQTHTYQCCRQSNSKKPVGGIKTWNKGIAESFCYNSISLQKAILQCVTGFQWYFSVLKC